MPQFRLPISRLQCLQFWKHSKEFCCTPGMLPCHRSHYLSVLFLLPASFLINKHRSHFTLWARQHVKLPAGIASQYHLGITSFFPSQQMDTMCIGFSQNDASPPPKIYSTLSNSKEVDYQLFYTDIIEQLFSREALAFEVRA